MSVMRALRIFAVIYFTLVGNENALSESIDISVNKVISDIRHDFIYGGQAVVAVSAGANRPENEMLYFIDSENQERIYQNGIYQAFWLSPSEIIAQQTYEVTSKKLGNRIIRTDRHGRLLEVLSDQEGVTCVAPNGVGQWVALKTDLNTGVIQGIEFHGLSEESKFPSFMKFDQYKTIRDLSHIVWSPDFDKLALAAWVRVKSKRGYLPRIGLVSSVADGVQVTGDVGLVNARPLFWKKEWIYATTHNGLYRCDFVKKNSCDFVYSPGDGKYIFSGTVLNNDHALLLIQNNSLDPLEIRATEIHKVDLLNGNIERILTLPEGVFVSGIDWI